MRRCYPVLTPFKFNGVTAKPPAFVEFDPPAEGEEHSAQAHLHIAAGVVSPEWATPEEDGTETEQAARKAAGQQKPAKAKK